MMAEGVKMATDLELTGRTNWLDRYKAMSDVIAQGGEQNYAQAQAMWNELMPGTNIDFSRAMADENRADFAAGMTFVAQLVATGASQEEAMTLAQQQGTLTQMGVSQQQFAQLYDNALTQGNPITASIHQFRQAAKLGEIDAETANAMVEAFMESETGLDFTVDAATGQLRFVPFDGFTKVTSLADITAGQSIKLTTPLGTSNGMSLPPGNYYVTVENETMEGDSNWWTGETTSTPRTVTYMVAASEITDARTGEVYPAGRRWMVRDERGTPTTQNGTGVGDFGTFFLNPLGGFEQA
jgi:hypothetical protein